MSEPQSVHAINGQIGAIESWARTPKARRGLRTEAARQGFLERLAREADPDGVMSEAERMAAAENLRRAHMKRIAQKSVKVRAKKSAPSA